MLPVHFGLGEATVVDEVRIHWPIGLVQTITDIAGSQILPVTEPLLSLSIAREGEGIVLRWPAVRQFLLESSNLVDEPWSEVTDVPGQTGGQKILPLTVTGGARFFRLRYLR